MHDAFLATDAIGTERNWFPGEYNTNVFMFGDSDLRKLMADIPGRRTESCRNAI